MRTARLVALLTACAAVTVGLAQAADDFLIYVYPCPRAGTAIVVDGALDEPAWTSAPLVTGFTYYNQRENAPVQTLFGALYDDRFLYFGVSCEEPEVARLRPVSIARDSLAVFHQEAVEIFIDPQHSHEHYFQFGFNAAASIYDSERTDSRWNAAVVAATSLGLSAWFLEVAIPWTDLGIAEPRAGTMLGFNVCRDRYLSGGTEWMNWSQTKANFHDPDRFAHLVLSPTPEELAALTEEFRKGERTGPLYVFSEEGFAGDTYRAMAERLLRTFDEQVAEFNALRDESPPDAKAGLEAQLASILEKVTPARQALASGQTVDAALWLQLDRQISAALADLSAALWGARIQALFEYEEQGTLP